MSANEILQWQVGLIANIKLHFFFPPTLAKSKILFYFIFLRGSKKKPVGPRRPNDILRMPLYTFLIVTHPTSHFALRLAIGKVPRNRFLLESWFLDWMNKPELIQLSNTKPRWQEGSNQHQVVCYKIQWSVCTISIPSNIFIRHLM